MEISIFFETEVVKLNGYCVSGFTTFPIKNEVENGIHNSGFKNNFIIRRELDEAISIKKGYRFTYYFVNVVRGYHSCIY